MKFEPLVSGNVRVNGKIVCHTRAIQLGVPSHVLLDAALLHLRAIMGIEGFRLAQRESTKRKRLKWSHSHIKRIA